MATIMHPDWDTMPFRQDVAERAARAARIARAATAIVAAVVANYKHPAPLGDEPSDLTPLFPALF